ncbi:MAG TPA: hypothetical protein VLV32_08945 [Burkholderiales bacterium]|nr:hypothetical protein [Burkholderiales bacterium]
MQSDFRTIVPLIAPQLKRDCAKYHLNPGIQVDAEINLGSRTVFEYLLSPIQKTMHEAGREL